MQIDIIVLVIIFVFPLYVYMSRFSKQIDEILKLVETCHDCQERIEKGIEEVKGELHKNEQRYNEANMRKKNDKRGH